MAILRIREAAVISTEVEGGTVRTRVSNVRQTCGRRGNAREHGDFGFLTTENNKDAGEKGNNARNNAEVESENSNQADEDKINR